MPRLRTPRRQHLRADAIRRYLDEGQGAAQVAAELDVPAGTVYRWAWEERERRAHAPRTDAQRSSSDPSDQADADTAAPPGEPEDERADVLIGHLESELDRLRAQVKALQDMQQYIHYAIGKQVPALAIDQARYAAKQAQRDRRPKPKREPLLIQTDVSDVHGGSLVLPEDTLGLHHYDVETFRERAGRWRDGLLSVTEAHRAVHPIDRLAINLMGDMLEGLAIFPGQDTEMDLDATEQPFVVAQVLAQTLAEIAEEFKTVDIYVVPGNHGWVMGKRRLGGRKVNLDMAVYRLLEILLQNVPNLTIGPMDTVRGILAYEVWPGQVHAITHGHQIRGWMSLPFYGGARASTRFMSTIRRSDLTALHIGHHHQLGKIAGNVAVLYNGSWPGGSTHSVNDMLVGDLPRQNLFAIHPTMGIVAQHDLILAEDVKLVAGARGVLQPEPEEEKASCSSGVAD